jgi:lysyl-tRNA synthetase class 2
MKRMLAAGFEKIFQICKCFREGERGTHHLPEFTMLEWYHRGMNYTSLMRECRELVVSVASEVGCSYDIVYQDNKISLNGAWEYLSVQDAFDRYAPITLKETMEEGAFDTIMACDIEPNLGRERPTFLYDYPFCPGALAKGKESDPDLAERFELYIAGVELANGFSELTGVYEHRLMFQKVREYRASMGKSLYPVSEKFLGASSTMPEAAGIALGVDRMAMIFTNSEKIDEVVSFTPELL